MTTATGGKVVTFILMKISLKPPLTYYGQYLETTDRHRKTTDRKSDLFYFLARMVIRFV